MVALSIGRCQVTAPVCSLFEPMLVRKQRHDATPRVPARRKPGQEDDYRTDSTLHDVKPRCRARDKPVVKALAAEIYRSSPHITLGGAGLARWPTTCAEAAGLLAQVVDQDVVIGADGEDQGAEMVVEYGRHLHAVETLEQARGSMWGRPADYPR